MNKERIGIIQFFFVIVIGYFINNKKSQYKIKTEYKNIIDE